MPKTASKKTPEQIDAERRKFLAEQTGLNLDDPDAPLEAVRTVKAVTAEGIQWAPAGLDPHTMPVTDIQFESAMVEQFPDLSPRSRRAASDFLFAQFKSYGRNKDRNSLLHHKIGEFLAREHRTRETGGGFVKSKIGLANTLAEHGVTAADLEEFLAFKAQQTTKEKA